MPVGGGLVRRADPQDRRVGVPATMWSLTRSSCPPASRYTREVLGTAVGDSESFDFWREFLAGLKARGLSGVHPAISDAHAGLKAAVAQQLTGASWQRCRVHFMRNVGSAVSSKHVPPVMAAVATIFAHADPMLLGCNGIRSPTRWPSRSRRWRR
jgi:hypothetical protein